MACAYCVERQPILDLQQLHIGDHIAFGRFDYIKRVLSVLCENSLNADEYLYFHHAIVTEIDHLKRRIKLIEFASVEMSLVNIVKTGLKGNIRERELNFDANHRDLNLYLVIHKRRGENPPSPQEIVKNARRLLQEAHTERYNLLTNNCEHIANLCLTKHRVSLQILQVRDDTERLLQRFLTNPPTWFTFIVGKLWKKIIYLIMKLEKVLKSFKNKRLFSAYANLKRFFGKWMACKFAIAVIFLAIDIYQFYSANRDKALCEECIQKWLVNLFRKFLDTLISSKFVLLETFGCRLAGFLAYEILFSDHDYIPLKSLKAVEPGDVITFNLYMPFSFHDAIVVSWARQFAAGNMKPLTRPFSSMCEQEVLRLFVSLIEEFFRNESHPRITYLDIHVQDVSERTGRGTRGSTFYQQISDVLETPPQLAVQKDGSGQWKKIAVKADEENEDTPRIHFLIGDEHIKLYHNLNRIYQVEIIHYDLEAGLRFPDVLFGSKRVVKFETTALDLARKHTVYKKTFAKDSKAYRNQPKVIVQKAEERIGERRWSVFGRWSSNLAEECVLVDQETYYSRGERFARMVYASCPDLVHHKVMTGSTSSSLIDYVVELLRNRSG